MRRKGRDTSSKSSDSPKKSTRSSTRYSKSNNKTNESSNQTIEEVSQQIPVSVNNSEIENKSMQQNEYANENHTEIAENSAEECNRLVEDVEESEKGKSNDIVKSNVEQSRDINEPEIENENVQGTAQSPSKDNDENVQNVNDLQTNVEENKGTNQQTSQKDIEENLQQTEESNFESEYVQDTDVNDKSSLSNKNDSSMQGSQNEEKSTTPEKTGHTLNRSVSNESSQSKSKETTERKKITLRRSPPIKERRSSAQETSVQQQRERRFSVQESVEKENKDSSVKSKKIVLKRPTLEEKVANKEADVAEGAKRRRSSVNEDENQTKRRISNSTDERNQDSNTEDIPQKPTTKVKLRRSTSLGGNTLLKNVESTDDSHQELNRKPLWGRPSNWLDNLTASMYKIDMESIKIVCPTVKFLQENELKLESVPRERKKSEPSEIVRKRKLSMENTLAKSEDEEGENGKDSSDVESEAEVAKENIIAINRKISIVDDTASKLKPPPSPPKNPVSDVLFITNLVRPFTVKQLKELLERTGKIKEDGFWTDRIKSKCYVQYDTQEEAESTRNALHGVNWPIGNGKQLVIDYATEEDLRKAQNPVPAILQHVPEKKIPEKENWKEPEPLAESRFKEKDRFGGDVGRRRRSSEREPFNRGRDADRRRSRSRSRERNKPGKFGHRSYTPDGHSAMKRPKKEEPPPQKLMDDLFLKTKATPSIYWQPLSPEEIATKQKQRMVRMEEHKRRIEQSRDRRVRDNRRPPPYRRR